MSAPWAYYNEIDDYAAQWLENLIRGGHIAPGVVDRRSILDVHPDDLRGFRQCHFFAGIGVWSYALRLAGWPDDRPVWTGSCPCQPFSAAGQGAGFDDERHLWPHFHWLIQECRPPVVYGEQVASRDVDPWIDLVSDDLEGLGYAVGAVAFPSAGVGAPHIRDRTYWMAHASGAGLEGRQRAGQRTDSQLAAIERGGAAGWLGNTQNLGDRGQPGILSGAASSLQGEASRKGNGHAFGASSAVGGLADPNHGDEHRNSGAVHRSEAEDAGHGRDHHGPFGGGEVGGRPGPVNGLWRDADWLLCRDGKWRPVEPGTFPLAHGAPARVGRLRAYGNAINAVAAEVFIRSTM